MNSSEFLGSGHDLYALILICNDCSRFLHVDLSNFASSSEFLCICHDFYGFTPEFYILTS